MTCSRSASVLLPMHRSERFRRSLSSSTFDRASNAQIRHPTPCVCLLQLHPRPSKRHSPPIPFGGFRSSSISGRSASRQIHTPLTNVVEYNRRIACFKPSEMKGTRRFCACSSRCLRGSESPRVVRFQAASRLRIAKEVRLFLATPAARKRNQGRRAICLRRLLMPIVRLCPSFACASFRP